jgi:hypothetical protein
MELKQLKFSSPVIKALKYYVYLYSHPVTGDIFYVGKGKGNRIFQHLKDKSDSQKVMQLKELKSEGLSPKLEILVHGLEDEKTALRVESSVIDLIGIDNLTNKQTGYKSATFGRMSLHQVNALYDGDPVNIDHPAILIRINQAFRYSMTEMELYDYTRGQWKVNPDRANQALYGIAVYQGIIQQVYTIENWYKAGSTYSVRQGNENISRGEKERLEGRYEFIGNLAPLDIREKYRYKSVSHYFKPGNSNPIMYCNV